MLRENSQLPERGCVRPDQPQRVASHFNVGTSLDLVAIDALRLAEPRSGAVGEGTLARDRTPEVVGEVGGEKRKGKSRKANKKLKY